MKNQYKIIKTVINKWYEKKKKDEEITFETKIEKEREQAQCGTLPQGPGKTIRSKIEDTLTEEKLKDRESATYANTPWAPSGPERI